MSFFKEVGTLYGFSLNQSMQLEWQLKKLQQQLNAVKESMSDAVAQQCYADFQQLMLENQFKPQDIENFLNHLYFMENYREVVTVVIQAFYQAGGNPELFADTYSLIQADLMLE